MKCREWAEINKHGASVVGRLLPALSLSVKVLLVIVLDCLEPTHLKRFIGKKLIKEGTKWLD